MKRKVLLETLIWILVLTACNKGKTEKKDKFDLSSKDVICMMDIDKELNVNFLDGIIF